MGSSLGLPNFGGASGPHFAYLSGSNFYNYQFSLGGTNVRDGANFSSQSSTYATATKSLATPVPTPALLPGLLGLGAVAWRKRKSNLAASVKA